MGSLLGEPVGANETEGTFVGCKEGKLEEVGASEGDCDGATETEGYSVGTFEGKGVSVGKSEGLIDTSKGVGAAVGCDSNIGELVGHDVGLVV